MRMVQIISKKREGEPLAESELREIVEGFVAGRIPDYQMSALLMAIVFNGMTDEETAILTRLMTSSGAVLDLSSIGRPVVDKHSTGGVGDKVTLVATPIVAAAGLVVPMISGRSLGHTGGTLDKLESIPGFRTGISLGEFTKLLERNGAAIISQTEEIAPADRKIYALRDATSTVASIPLIASSVMSKKLAEGLDALVLDVKVGSGAFMKTEEEARHLASIMCAVGHRNGTRTEALVTRMEEPLGRAVGNAVEVAECVEALRGHGPEDLVELSLEIAAHMIALGMTKLGFAYDLGSARKAARERLDSGAALERFRRMIESQGGDPKVVDDPSLLERAPAEHVVTSDRTGYVSSMNAEEIGWAINGLGAGRGEVRETVDHGVGLLMEARIGDAVRPGDPLFRVLARDDLSASLAAQSCRAAISLADAPPPVRPLILETIDSRG